jgi:hypothetical protein
LTRHIPRLAAVGFLAIAALLAFPSLGLAQVANPTPGPNPLGWHTEPFTVAFSHPALPCDPSQAPYDGPDTASGSLTSTCDDPNDSLPPEIVTYPFKYDATPPNVTITDGPANGEVSEDRTPSFSFTSDEPSTRCELDDSSFASCASPWVSSTPVGDGPHRFTVSAMDQAGNADAETRTWTIAERPTNTSPPVIVGVAAEAETLNTNTGTWSGGTHPIDYTIQWQLCDASGVGCESIGGATGPEYVVRPGDVGHRLRVEVRARNPAGDVFAYTTTDVVIALDRSLPQSTIIRQPPNPTNRRTATFTFEASRAGSTFECKLNAGAFAACVSPKTYSGLAARTHTFQVRAMFTARNNERFVEDTPAAAIWRIDALRPPAPGFVRVRAGDQRLSLTWTVARVADIRGTRVVRSRVRRPNTLVLRLLARSRLSDGGLRNGALYRYVLRTVDRAGNLSLAKVVYGRPRDPLLAPRDGAVVTRPPLLRWLARPHATYYNLQLYRVRPGADLKMLSTWPIRPSYQVRQRWRFGGLRILRPGMYRWYVWPGFGSFAEERFGRLMGTSVFTKS